MKKIRLIALTLCFLMIMSVVSYAHGNMMAVYKYDGSTLYYKVIPEEQLANEATSGWTSVIPSYDTASITPMYNDAGLVAFVPSHLAESQTTAGWYYSPRKVMYSADRRQITVSLNEIEVYENAYWYIEPVGLMKKGSEYKMVIESEFQKYRSEDWELVEYSAELYDLTVKIASYLKNKRGQYGVYVKNLKTDEYMVINDKPYAAASIIKLYVMAGTYNQIAQGSFSKTNTVYNRLNSMITVSDNYSSNFLVKTMGGGNYKAGFDAENALTWSLGCYNTAHNSLFIGCGDYVSYGKNTVSPMDCGILLERIYDRTLISPEYSNEMLYMMTKQQRRNKIPYLLPRNTLCANKTGETSTVESDVGIVYSPACDYIICVLSNNSPTGISDIRNISLITYNHFNGI